ncbi:hypothetical protein [Rhodococcus sp. YH3-3]|uniref:hypothetical protein n=1 Tax=Rhodococcus sp. YH3-3 TaxID=1803579 RepID=UPI0009EDD64D|nr:hypothetical protein [Rhodococcus sp. YH3-3]
MPGDAAPFKPNMPVTLVAPDVEMPTRDNAEIAYVREVNDHELVVTRAQEGTLPMQVKSGWRVVASLTVKTITDIEHAVAQKVSPEDLAEVAMSGEYQDILNIPEPVDISGKADTAYVDARDALVAQTSELALEEAVTKLSPRTYEVPDGVENYQIPTDASVVIALGSQIGSWILPVPVENKQITVINSSGDPVSVDGAYAPHSIVSGGQTTFTAVSVSGDDLLWAFIETGSVDAITKLSSIEAGAQVNEVNSVNSKQGAIVLTKSDIGLGNADNTSDLDKPVSAATQTALNGKVDRSSTANVIYGRNSANVESAIPMTETAATPWTIPRRDSAGRMKVVAAAAAEDAVNKFQMDAADALKVNKAGDTMTGQLRMASSAANGLIRVEQAANNSNNGIRMVNAGVTLGANVYFSDASTLSVISDGTLNLNGAGNRVRISGSEVISGTGFPNGVVSAPVGSTYIDTNATNGAIEWKKATGIGNTGWVVSVGDISTTIPASDLLNGWDYESAIFGMRLARTGNIVTLIIPSIGLRGTSATANIFYALPAGYRINTTGNYGMVGYIAAGGVIAVTRDFNNLSCSARTNISGILSWRTSEPWPAA